MTSDRNNNTDVENLRRAALNSDWYLIINMYREKRELRMAKITKGDTVLHMAVSSGKEYEVEYMVDIVCGKRISEQDKKSMPLPPVDENGNEKKHVLGAKNDQGNTPLHLAASIGNVRMCKKIVGQDSSLIAISNHAGETPLFLAAFHGQGKAFLWLHYQFMGSPGGVSSTDIADCIKRDNDDTILHCALEEEHIGFFRVKKKERATTSDEQEQRERKSSFSYRIAKIGDRISNSLDYLFMVLLFPLFVLEFYFTVAAMYAGETYRDSKIRRLIYYSRYYLPRILLFPLYALKYLLKAAGKWFLGIRNMKEKHTWSLQITEQLLSVNSCKCLFENSYEEESEAGSKIVDTPLMIAAKNVLTEMVENILKKFEDTMKVVNEEEKNIVLLAAEKRQTKLYQILYGNENVDKSLFRQVDKDGNTALHLAAIVGVNLDMQVTTMVEEFKWFEFVKTSVPSELRERYNKDGKTAEEIFKDSYKEHMKSDREWLNQTSQTCSVASTLVASMAFSFIVSDKLDKKNIFSLLLALSLSLTSTISFLAILAFRSQSLKFWKYAPFMIQIAILTMFGSIVALWISLMLHGQSLTTHAILGTPIAIFTIVLLPIFIGPSLMSLVTDIPPPSRKTTSAIYYRRPTPKMKSRANDSL